MALNDVKEITVPVNGTDKAVRKIEDSNGNIIWGSASAFPYRVLEYIDIPAAAYIDTNSQGNSRTGLKLEIDFNPDGESSEIAGNLFGAIYYNGSTYYRYHLSPNSTGLLQVWYGTGNNAYKNADLYSTTTGKHVIELNSHSANDNKLYVDGVDKGTYSTPSTTNTGLLYVGARRFNNNGTVTINNYSRKIRVYYLEIMGSNIGTDPNDTSKCYPVQRKSDGKVGLFKIWNNGQAVRFCTSETSTECIAGPTVNEYYTGTEWL